MEGEFTFDTILADTDVYMWNLKMTNVRNPPDCLANKVYHVYKYYRNIQEGALDHKINTHIEFWKLIQNNPSIEDIDRWMAKNTSEWHSTKYGLTNGRIDWYSGGCFGENSKVRMGDQSLKEIKNIKKGDALYIPTSEKIATVICVIKWENPVPCIKVPGKDLLITPYHPILNTEDIWTFPINMYDQTSNITYYDTVIYNLILDSGHVIEIDGVKACTLAHNMYGNPVIMHRFFSTKKVIKSLQTIDRNGWNNGFVVVHGTVRDPETNLVINFI